MLKRCYFVKFLCVNNVLLHFTTFEYDDHVERAVLTVFKCIVVDRPTLSGKLAIEMCDYCDL